MGTWCTVRKEVWRRGGWCLVRFDIDDGDATSVNNNCTPTIAFFVSGACLGGHSRHAAVNNRRSAGEGRRGAESRKAYSAAAKWRGVQLVCTVMLGSGETATSVAIKHMARPRCAIWASGTRHLGQDYFLLKKL